MNSCPYPQHTDRQSGRLAGLGCLSVVLGFFGFVVTCFALLGMVYCLAVHDYLAAEVVVIIGAIMAVGVFFVLRAEVRRAEQRRSTG